MSLFEVLLAIAIFLMAMTALSQLISGGRRSSLDASLRTQAVLHAETIMNEVIAGAKPMEVATSEQITEGDTNWFWSLSVEDAEVDGLKDLTVTVVHVSNGDRENIKYTLRRFVRDPAVFEEAALEADAEAEAEAAP